MSAAYAQVATSATSIVAARARAITGMPSFLCRFRRGRSVFASSKCGSNVMSTTLNMTGNSIRAPRALAAVSEILRKSLPYAGISRSRTLRMAGTLPRTTHESRGSACVFGDKQEHQRREQHPSTATLTDCRRGRARVAAHKRWPARPPIAPESYPINPMEPHLGTRPLISAAGHYATWARRADLGAR